MFEERATPHRLSVVTRAQSFRKQKTTYFIQTNCAGVLVKSDLDQFCLYGIYPSLARTVGEIQIVTHMKGSQLATALTNPIICSEMRH